MIPEALNWMGYNFGWEFQQVGLLHYRNWVITMVISTYYCNMRTGMHIHVHYNNSQTQLGQILPVGMLVRWCQSMNMAETRKQPLGIANPSGKEKASI